MNRKIERHGEFVSKLGDRLLDRYTDGGPAIKVVQKHEPHPIGWKPTRRVRRNQQRLLRRRIGQQRRLAIARMRREAEEAEHAAGV